MYPRRVGHAVWVWLLCLAVSAIQAGAEPLTRVEAVRIAVEQNPDVIVARKVWEAARARAWQERALPNPEFELEYEGLPGVFSLGQYGERTIGATQTIEFPVKWWLRSHGAGKEADAVRMSTYEMTKLDVATRVKVAYDRVLANQQVLGNTSRNLELARDLLAKARVRLEAGDVPPLEVLRAKVEAGRARNQVTVAQNNLSVSRAELNALMARDIRAPLELAGDLAYASADLDLERLRNLALEQRPELVGAGLALEGVRSLRSVAVTSVLPDLNLGVFRQTFRGPAGQQKAWRVSFGLEIPLWGIFRNRGEIAAASAEVGHAAARANAIRDRVLLEVESAFLHLVTAEEQVELFRDWIVPEAERAHEVAARSYQEGKATYLELLEAQRTLMGTRVEYVEILLACRSSLAELERAVGENLE